MRRLAGILAALSLLLVAAPVQDAAAARHLSYDQARRNATRFAAAQAAADPSIVQWEVGRGFRFTARKFVFVWWATKNDGTVCAAQLVTRFRSSTTNKLISYFRLETCS